MVESTEKPILSNVVVGTDFSPAAEVALSWAMLIARTHGATLHVVHAVTRTLPLVERFEPASPIGKASSLVGQQRLSRLEECLRSPDQPMVCHLSHDRPSVAILKTAQQSRAGLIVTGTRGEGGLRHLLLGSTAERVTQRSFCPVLTVPPQCPSARRWPRRVLVATDFSIEADAALQAVERLIFFRDEAADLLLLTVFNPPDGLEELIEAAMLWRDYVEECRRLLEERKESAMASNDSTHLSIDTLVREGRPAEQIVRVAREEEVDLIALGSRGSFAAGQSFLGSVSKRVLQAAPCPTVIVPSLLSSRMRSAARG
jgi:universal stress protein E